MSATVVEHDAIELLDLLKEMFLDGKLEIPPAIIIAIAGDGKYAARLFFQTRPHKSSTGERLLLGKMELFDVVRNPVKKTEILALIKNSSESLLNEIGSILSRSEDPLKSRSVQLMMAVADGGLGDCC